MFAAPRAFAAESANLTGDWVLTSTITETDCPGDEPGMVQTFAFPVTQSAGGSLSGGFAFPDSGELFTLSGAVSGASVTFTIIDSAVVTATGTLNPDGTFISGAFEAVSPDNGGTCGFRGTFTVSITPAAEPPPGPAPSFRAPGGGSNRPIRVSFEDCPDPFPPATLIPAQLENVPPRGVIAPPPCEDLSGLWEITTIFAVTDCPGDRPRGWTVEVPVTQTGDFVSGGFTAPDSGEEFSVSGSVAGDAVFLSVVNGLLTQAVGVLDPSRCFIRGTFSGVDPDGSLEGEPCHESGTFVIRILHPADRNTVQGALDFGALRLRAAQYLAEAKFLVRLATAKSAFEEVRRLNAFHEVRAKTRAQLEDDASWARLDLLMIRAESIDDARTVDAKFPTEYPAEHRELLSVYRVATEVVNAALHEAQRLLFCPRAVPPPVPADENCAYILIITNTDIPAEGSEAMTKTTDALVKSIEQRHPADAKGQGKEKDHCNIIVRVNVSKASLPVVGNDALAAHLALQAAIDAALDAANIPAGAKACEIHTLGHGSGVDIIFGGLHYSLAPDFPGVLPPNALPIGRFNDLLGRYLCCKDGKVFLWHCFLATPPVDVRGIEQELRVEFDRQKTELENTIKRLKREIALLEIWIPKLDHGHAQSAQNELDRKEKELAAAQQSLQEVTTNLALFDAAIAGQNLDEHVKTQIKELTEANEDIKIKNEEIDKMNEGLKKEGAALAKELENQDITRDQYDARLLQISEDIENNEVQKKQNVATREENEQLLAAWTALQSSSFAQALARLLTENCVKRTVTAIDGAVEFPANAAPRPLRTKDHYRAQEVTFGSEETGPAKKAGGKRAVE